MKRVACLLAGSLAIAASAYAAPATVPTFAKDVAPIVFNKCATCHRAGEVAPMSLLSYDDVRPWAKAIKNKVVAREMPPWGADPAHTLQDAERPQPHAGADRHHRRVGGRRRAERQRRRHAAGAEVRRRLDVRPRAGRDARDAGRVRHPGRGRARRPDVLLEGAVERGSVRADARASSGQPRRRASRRRSSSSTFPEGATHRQRPARVPDGKASTDRGAGAPDAPTTRRCLARTSCCRGCRAAASTRTATTSASAFPPASTSTGRFTTTRSAKPETDRTRARHLVQQGAGDARAPDSPGRRPARDDQGRAVAVSRGRRGSRVHAPTRAARRRPQQDAEHSAVRRELVA